MGLMYVPMVGILMMLFGIDVNFYGTCNDLECLA